VPPSFSVSGQESSHEGGEAKGGVAVGDSLPDVLDVEQLALFLSVWSMSMTETRADTAAKKKTNSVGDSTEAEAEVRERARGARPNFTVPQQS